MAGDSQLRTRQSLLNRIKSREDQTAWEDFFKRYRQLIYNVATKAGLTDTEAQEVVQETMVAVSRRIEGFKVDPSRGSFSAWLMRLTRWRISDQFRKRRKAGCVLTAAPGARPNRQDDSGVTSTVNRVPDPAGGRFETAWEQEWEQNLASAALERVKLQIGCKQYQIFDLHVLQNLSVAETARTVGVSAASVYVAKYRISRLLRREIQALQRQLRAPDHWVNGSR
jgi:RNA polymerase sigma factor (sigma-70 family)